MKHRSMLLVLVAWLAVPALAKGGAKDKATTGATGEIMEDASTAVFDLIDKEAIQVKFDKGSATLGDAEAQKLRALIQSARQDGALGEVIVAAWSDKPYPVSSDTKLEKSDEELAEKRGDALVKALKDLGVKDVETYSMASEPVWIAEVFGLKEAEVKKSYTGELGDDVKARRIAEKLREKGGPSTAVVIVRNVDESLSH